MNAVRVRLMAIGAAVVFVASARSLEAIGMEYAVEDCFVAALIATILTAVAASL